MSDVHRTVGWAKADAYGHEVADVTIGSGTLRARGVAIGVTPVLYRLEYELETGPDFVTRRLSATTNGAGWSCSIELSRSPGGTWTCATRADGVLVLERAGDGTEGSVATVPGGDLDAVRGALDCDLHMSPLTNTMPVLRHGMLAGGPAHDFQMAWVALPTLSVVPSRQRYVPLGPLPAGGRTIRYELLDSDFRADVSFDADGLVIDYPELGWRVG